jgi:hypothetical protein
MVYSGYPSSPTNKIDLRDITEILLKVALNTITLTLTFKGLSAVRPILALTLIFFNFYVYCILKTLFCFNTQIRMLQ